MFKLSQDQQDAVDMFGEFLQSDETEMALMGHAGTGKTSTIKHMIKAGKDIKQFLASLLGERGDLNIKLTATTNKAAQVLSEKTGMDTQTIHSLLCLKVFNDTKTGETKVKQADVYKPYANTIIFIDEASMVDSVLLKVIREATKKNCKVVYVLDPYQLAPVNERVCPVSVQVTKRAILDTIHRQGANNPIIDLAEAFRESIVTGVFPDITDYLSPEIQLVKGQTFKDLITAQYTDPNHHHERAKVVAWTNRRVIEYNKYISNLIYNTSDFSPMEYVTTNRPIIGQSNGRQVTVAKTDAIFQIQGVSPYTVNVRGIPCHEVDTVVGRLQIPVSYADYQTRLKELAGEAKKKKYWGEYFDFKEAFHDIRPVHACTIHKSQGSTYNTTYIDLHDIGRNSKISEVGRLLYVAVTRAASNIVLYGQLPSHFRINR